MVTYTVGFGYIVVFVGAFVVMNTIYAIGAIMGAVADIMALGLFIYHLAICKAMYGCLSQKKKKTKLTNVAEIVGLVV